MTAQPGSAEPAPRGEGVSFPLVDGARSTTATGRAVFADAARPLDPELATRIEGEDDWRTGYLRHVRALCEAETRDPERADQVPAAGLRSLHERFTFVREDEPLPLLAALGQLDRPELTTVTVEGRGDPSRGTLEVPYRGELLEGDGLHRQLDRWVEAGTVEPSFAAAIRRVVANPDWLDLRDRTVALLGAGAEMGPLRQLSRWGATVAAVDVARPELWSRILRTVREGTGRAHVPLHREVPGEPSDQDVARAAGADLLAATPELCRWLAELDGPLTVGNYVYADGADNVRVSMAVDAITARLLAARDDVSLAMLATPTDVFAAPAEAVEMSMRRYSERRPTLFERAARSLSRERLYAPNYVGLVESANGTRYGIADAAVAQQGPNYLLAKRLQRWRARQARADGVVTSANIAPATRTRSVMKNRVLAAAYGAAGRFGVEVFEPDTSNTLMAALLVHDLRHDGAVANPATPLRHPLELFVDAASHGGLWRIPFAPRTVLPLAALRGLATGAGRRAAT